MKDRLPTTVFAHLGCLPILVLSFFSSAALGTEVQCKELVELQRHGEQKALDLLGENSRFVDEKTIDCLVKANAEKWLISWADQHNETQAPARDNESEDGWHPTLIENPRMTIVEGNRCNISGFVERRLPGTIHLVVELKNTDVYSPIHLKGSNFQLVRTKRGVEGGPRAPVEAHVLLERLSLMEEFIETYLWEKHFVVTTTATTRFSGSIYDLSGNVSFASGTASTVFRSTDEYNPLRIEAHRIELEKFRESTGAWRERILTETLDGKPLEFGESRKILLVYPVWFKKNTTLDLRTNCGGAWISIPFQG